MPYSDLFTHIQSTLRLRRAWGDSTQAITTLGERAVDVVSPDLSAACDTSEP